MRQALIIGARPSFTEGKQFPTVPLGEGSWQFKTENHLDSLVTIFIESEQLTGPIELNGASKLFNGPLKATAKIEKRGTENYINVFAELIK